MSEERKINGIHEFLQMSMTNNMPLSVNEKRQIFDLIIKEQRELERLHSIIKEVREYIENTKMFTNGDEKEFTLKETWYGKELLKILDKVDKENI